MYRILTARKNADQVILGTVVVLMLVPRILASTWSEIPHSNGSHWSRMRAASGSGSDRNGNP